MSTIEYGRSNSTEAGENVSADAAPTLDIRLSIIERVNLAFYQNSIPVINEIAIENKLGRDLTDLQISVETEPQFLQPTVWQVDRIPAGVTHRLRAIDVKMEPAALQKIGEIIRSQFSVAVRSGTHEIARARKDIDLLPPFHWSGGNSAPELLGAFVRPNDASVGPLLRLAAEKLREAGRNDAIDGYKTGKKVRAWELTEAIWMAIASEGIAYALPPASFGQDGQRVRGPTEILKNKIATCLDTSLLFAACLEQAGLNPLIVLTKGHAFAGLWLKDEDFSVPVLDDPSSLRKRMDLDEIVLFETTYATSSTPGRFRQAVDAAKALVAVDRVGDFELALDVRRARRREIRPLSLGEDVGVAAVDLSGLPATIVAQFEGAPALVEEGPEPPKVEDVAVGRLERWKRRLLDLSLRNKLLNFKDTKRSVGLECPDAADIEARLADGGKFKLLGRSYMLKAGSPIDPQLFANRHKDDAWKRYTHEAFQRGEIHVDLEDNELDVRLTDLYRSTRTAFEEGGSNILFLAIGFLKWTPTDKGGPYRAPVLLLPVSLERTSIRAGFKLAIHEDDARINPTLLEMLRQDFRLPMPEFDGDLPKQSDSADVGRIWRIVQTHVKDLPGWELTHDVVLSTFSFTKYLMWKDLVDRMDKLKRSALVSHLVDTPTIQYQGEASFVRADEIDKKVDPSGVFAPLIADSSQLSAILTAAKGKDFVLFGPPGTGKSQTIANIIAQCLAIGKTILFVSQKTAALQVVHRRLREIRLDDYCLEVHSTKAQKSNVLSQLDAAWRNRISVTAEEWKTATGEIRDLRNQLNALVSALGQRRQNGMTAYEAFGRVIADRNRLPDCEFDWPEFRLHTPEMLAGLHSACHALRIAIEAVGDVESHPLKGIEQKDWAPIWQDELVQSIDVARRAIPDLLVQTRRLMEALAFEMPEECYTSINIIKGVRYLAQHVLMREAHEGRHFLTGNGPQLRAHIGRLTNLIALERRQSQGLACRYRETVGSLDIDDLIESWKEASESNFLFRSSRQTKLRERLAQHALSPPPRDIGQELTTLKEVLQTRRAAQDLKAVLGVFRRTFAGVDTKPEEFASLTKWADKVEQAIQFLGKYGYNTTNLRERIAALVADRAKSPELERLIQNTIEMVDRPLSTFMESMKKIAGLVQSPDEYLGVDAGKGWIPTVSNTLTAWRRNASLTPLWAAWRRAVADARSAGIGKLVNGLESGALKAAEILPAFEFGYAKWWIKHVVTDEPALRNFVAHNHEDAIKRFVAADERVATLSQQIIRARLNGDIPRPTEFGTDPEWGALSREISRKSRHMPIRKLFSNIPNVLTRLTPCVMMSPLSIAQFLPADAKPFDVVVFDEASQIPVWDAIGAIARGKQAIIVGDPEQLPPTSVGERGIDDEDEESIEDLDSILDECMACNVPNLRLKWHYRSRHESLIAFSNARYYKGDLITFPSPVTDDQAVRFVHVPKGVYERGTSRVNREEARTLVGEVVRRLRDPSFELDKRSIGIVTFNGEQQRLIESLLDQERRGDPRLEKYFDDAKWFEPVFVKNLETVQGDERDIIFFSVAVGPDAAGRVSVQISSLNKEGGHRRLNVAITRARRELTVFSTLLPEQIDLSRTKSRGVLDFKHFLEYARSGPRALAEAAAPTGRDVESPFEAAVKRGLEAKNWTVHPQVGVSGFRVDLGVVHPDAPGRYFAGVECDGATYHRAATARDRDRLRELVLTDLGWKIERVWSTDWWMDPVRGINKLHDRLTALLTDDRVTRAKQAEVQVAPPERPAADDVVLDDDTGSNASDDDVTTEPPFTRAPAGNNRAETPAPVYSDPAPRLPLQATYRTANVDACGETPDRESFYEPQYRPKLRKMVAYIVQIEGPVFQDVLTKRICDAHGFERAKGRIQETVQNCIESRFPRSTEDGRRIIWPEASDKHAAVPFRYADADIRDYDDVPLCELASLAGSFIGSSSDDEEAVRQMAEAFGRKLMAQRRARFLKAIRIARATVA